MTGMDGLSFTRIALALSGRGGIVEGAHASAKALALEALHVARRYCEDVVQGKSGLRDRPQDALFTVEMEAGLGLAEARDGLPQPPGAPDDWPAPELAAWLALPRSRRISGGRVRRAEADRWLGHMTGTTTSAASRSKRKAVKRRNTELGDAIDEALKTFERDTPVTPVRVFRRLQDKQLIVQRDDRDWYLRGSNRRATLKSVRQALTRRTGRLPP